MCFAFCIKEHPASDVSCSFMRILKKSSALEISHEGIEHDHSLANHPVPLSHSVPLQSWNLHPNLGHVLTEFFAPPKSAPHCWRSRDRQRNAHFFRGDWDLSEAWVLSSSHTPLKKTITPPKKEVRWHSLTSWSVERSPLLFPSKWMDHGHWMNINWVIRIMSLLNWHKLEDTIHGISSYPILRESEWRNWFQLQVTLCPANI